MRNRSSVLTEEQRNGLRVENFVYHIIKPNEAEPDCLDEVVLANQNQVEFFRGIIAETGQGTQYQFEEQESEFLTLCNQMVEDPDENFLRHSKTLAQLFLNEHTGNATSEGVFIVARVTIPVEDNRAALIALIKVDYTPVLRQHRQEENRNIVELEEVVEALSEQKSSVQKRALIDISDEFDWGGLVVERKKTGVVLDTEDAISLYFKKFLGVSLKATDSALTKKIIKESYKWAKSYNGDLADKSPLDVKHAVVNLIEGTADDNLTYDDIRDRVCRHPQEVEVENMRQSFGAWMDTAGLGGVSFSPKPDTIAASDKKGKWVTDTGIKIMWNGERNPDILDKVERPDGSIVITITANNVDENE